MLFPQLDGPFRIAFQGEAPGILRKVEQSKYFAHHLNDQGRVIEGQAFGDIRFANTLFPDLFDIHGNTDC